MFRKLGFLFIYSAMFSIIGGHLVLLQSVAWVNMLKDFSQYTSWEQAVEMTFSGEYPCAICKVVTKAQQQEKRSPTVVQAEQKIPVFYEPTKSMTVILDRYEEVDYSASPDAIIITRNTAPLTPPPKVCG